MKKSLAQIAIVILAVVLWSVPSNLQAQEDAPAPADAAPSGDAAPASEEGADGGSENKGSAGLDFAFGKLGEDWFVTLHMMFGYQIDKLSFGVQVPLRLRVVDNAPEDEGTVREEDWDEPSDYLKIIRFIQWSQPGDVFYARVGELNGANIGHATIMSNYLNVVDIDHFQLGMDLEVNTLFGGVELVLDNFARPELFGGRAYVRPWSFVDEESYFTNWSVGTSVLTDINAPSTIDVDDMGAVIVDDENNLAFSPSAFTAWGLDTDFTVVRNEYVGLTPYMDHNFLFGEGGYGFHLGSLFEFALPGKNTINLRLEYQAMTDSYQPQYFDSLYEIQRFAYPSPAAFGRLEVPETKQSVVGELDSTHGYLAQLAVNLLDTFQITGLYRGTLRPNDNDLLIQMLIPALSWVKLGFTYAKSGFEEVGEAFSFDGAVFSAFARFPLGRFFSLTALYQRRWEIISDEDDRNYGQYQTVDEFNFGVGFALGF